MADAGPTLPGPSDGGTTFQLEVYTLAGGCLLAIPDAQRSWQLVDILSRLPQVPQGHRYQLLKGASVLAAGTAIAEWARPVDGRACVTAMVVALQTQEDHWQLGMFLIRAAGALNVEKVRALLNAGADASFRSGFPMKRTALHAAAEGRGRGRPGDVEDGEKEGEEMEARLQAVVRALLFARADVDAPRESLGETRMYALHYAVRRGSLGAVRMLLDARASIEAVARERYRCVPGQGGEWNSEWTVLHAATEVGSLPLVALLLERGSNVNAVRQYSHQEEYLPGERRDLAVRETALHMAVAGGHQAIVALLVQAGADASVARSSGGMDSPTGLAGCAAARVETWQDTSLEELCAGNPGMLDALRADSSAALLAGGGAFGAEVEAALAAIAARRAAA